MPNRTEALWRLLPGVRTRERPRFLFFTGLATLVSLAQTVGLAGTEALFLARFGVALLPVTFIGAALFTVLGSMVYAARVGGERNDILFVRMLLLGAVVLVAAAGAAVYGVAGVLPILFCLFYLTQAVYLNHLWTFAGDFFDTVASKRLIPLFTVGGSVAGVIGGLAVIVATRFVGPVSLIFAWAALLAAAAILIAAMRGQLLRWGSLDSHEADETSVEGIQAAMRYLGTSALGRWLSISAMTMMLSLFVLQYIYSDIFAHQFPDSSDLAAFFGIYLAATNVIEILIEVRVTPWLISRFGVSATNLLHPVLTIASFGGLAFGYGMPSAMAARMNRELLENSLSGPVRALIYNAMPQRYRGRTRAFLEGIIVYAGMALAGLVLLAIDAPDPFWLCVAGAIIAALYLGANLRVRREYFSTLVTELRAGRLDLEDLGEEVGHSAVETLAESWEQLLEEESERPSSMVLQFIPVLAQRGFVAPLIRAAAHPNADIRRSCINALRGSDVEEAGATLLVALEDEDARVRLAAVRALTRDRASSRPIEPLIKRLLDDPDSAVRAEAAVHLGEEGKRVLAGMIRSQDRATAFAALQIAPPSALEHVAERLTDDDSAIRAAALESHARAGVPPAGAEELLAYAEDPDPAIRRAGVMLLANVDDPAARGMLAGALADADLSVRFAAETVLGSLGEMGIEAVEPLLRAHREGTVVRAMRVIAKSRIPGARGILKGELRHRARDLWQGTVAFGNLPAGSGVAHSFLRAGYQDHILRSRRLSFRILELLEDPKVVRRVDKALQTGPARTRGDVLEVLSHMGDREAARLLVLIHETSPLEDRLAEISEWVQLPGSPEEIVELGRNSESRWIQMASRRIAAPEEGLQEEEELMERLLALKQIPLFANLSLEQLDALRKITREVEYLPNEEIVREGDLGGEIFLLIQGEVRFVKGHGTPEERHLSTQPAVSYFGEMAALDDMGRTATVIATQPSVMLCLDGDNLKDLIRQMPEISFQIMRVLTARVRQAEKTVRQTPAGGDALQTSGGR